MANKRKIIWLVEDDLATIDVYKTGLERTDDFKVETMTVGQDVTESMELVKKGKKEKPDLILLDLLLPDVNGLEVLKEIRKEKEGKDIPVYILTNYSDKELEKMGYNLKAKKHILKTDCSPTGLVNLVKKELKK